MRLERTKPNSNHGFTIVELMIATVVFSSLMLLLALGVIQITRAYYKGITQSNTQNTARNIMNNIAQAIQFSGGTITPLANSNAGSVSLCVGNTQYSYVLGYQLVSGTPSAQAGVYQTNYTLVENDNVTNCASAPTQDLLHTVGLTSGSKELLAQKMRLSQLTVTPLGNNLWQIDVRVVYGDDDLLTNPSNGTAATCKGTAGSQFCAVSELVTHVQQRVN